MNPYRDWPLLDEMPPGWKIDNTAGSPLAGYKFITCGKSVLHGQKRALLRVRKPQVELFVGDAPRIGSKPDMSETESGEGKKEWKHFDAPCARTVNELAREKFKQRMLADILCDLTICEIEGWCKLEYINQLKELIGSIARHECIDS